MILITGKQWEPRKSDVIAWELAFSHIDIHQEMLKMDCWLMANPGRRKTARGMNRFVVSWLGRVTVRTDIVGTALSTRSRDRSLEDDLTDTSWAYE